MFWRNGLGAIAPLLAFVLVLAASPASAHRLNESYVYFNVTDEKLSGRIEATLTDLGRVLPLDANGDGVVDRAETTAKAAEIFAFFAERLELTSNGARQRLTPTGIDFLAAPFGDFAQIRFDVPDLTPVPEVIEIAYRSPLTDVAPGHLGYALIESNTRTGQADNEAYVSLIFEPGDDPQTLSLVGEPRWKIFVDFVEHGVWHIWLGFDHVLFLITLLLPAVLVLVGGAWRPSESLRASLISVIKIVTTFTIAHSVTLSLAALQIITLPVQLVEAVIALSIAIVAFGNMVPVFHHRTLLAVFAFGLFHGFGFANVLAPLGLEPSRLATGLAAFNIGVELGQVAIVIVLFPVLFVLRRWRFYPFLALKLGSIALIAIALFWFVERTFDLLGPIKPMLAGLFG